MLIDMTPKPDVIETSDIGVTVQGFDENIVSDASYVATDNNLTDLILQNISNNTEKVSNLEHSLVPILNRTSRLIQTQTIMGKMIKRGYT
jgi:hypothetical protein